MVRLRSEQIAQYRRDGVPVVEDAISSDGSPRFVLRPPSGTRPASPRALFISVYGAGDAVPCAPGPLPGMHEDRIVRGGNPHRVRAEDYEIEVREFPKTPFFTQQLEQERLA